jgi:hypothetical protein
MKSAVRSAWLPATTRVAKWAYEQAERSRAQRWVSERDA